MPTLTKRVQVLFSPDQFSHLQTIAREQDASVGALIRKAVEDAYFRHQQQERLEAVQRMASLSLPVASWEQMEEESMRGCTIG